MMISMMNVVVLFMIQLLSGSTEALKDEVLKYVPGDIEASSHKSQSIQYSSLVQKAKEFIKDEFDIYKKKINGDSRPFPIHVKQIRIDDQSRLFGSFKPIPCKDKTKSVYVEINTVIDETIIAKVCSKRKGIDKLNGSQNMSRQIFIRKKRDLNETAKGDGDHEELPKPEKLLWGGPVQHYNQDLRAPNSHSTESIHMQRITNYQNRLPSLENSRFHQDSSTHFKNFLKESEYDINSEVQSNAFKSHVNGITKQFHQNDPYNGYLQTPRFPEVPARPPNSFYPIPSLSSLGEAGASLLHLLNPMNLFRPYLPPPVPNTGNHLPHNTNQFPYNTNSLREFRNPSRPVTYELDQTAWPHEEEIEEDGSFQDSGKITYKIIKDENQHDYGHEYKEDSPLRDDIYVGKDGNLYIRDSNHNKGNKKSNSHFDLYNEELMFATSNDEKTLSSHGRYEEQDIQGIDSHGDKYTKLLKNHNMNEDVPNVFHTKYRDFFSDDKDFFDLNTLDHKDIKQLFQYETTNDKNRPTLSVQREFPQGWAPGSHGRINYPTYYYVPRPVMLPTRYRSLPRRNMGPPRPNPVIQSNPRFPGISPSSSQVINPFLHRPSPTGYTDNDGLDLFLGSNRKITRFDGVQAKRVDSENHSGARRISNSHGFYPGNGFFDADFPTLVQMAPLKRGKEKLPNPLPLNGTSLVDGKNATMQASPS